MTRSNTALPSRRSRRLLPLLAVTLSAVPFLAACSPDAIPQPVAEVAPPVHVDSVFPIEEELRRFRATLADSTDALDGGAESLDALVSAFLAALADADRPALDALAISATEFAYLYYPSSRFAKPPYELSPALVWFQTENYGSRGLDRALQRYGGRPLEVVEYLCPEYAISEEGGNRVRGGCVVRMLEERGDTTDLSLFGGILEREGRFKFISYGNRL